MTTQLPLREVDFQGGAHRLADSVAAVVESTAARSSGFSASPMVRLIAQYDHELSLEERSALQRAYLILLDEAIATLSANKTLATFQHLLALGARIIPLSDARLRRDVRRLIVRAVDERLRVNDFTTAVACLNFILNLGLDVGDEKLRRWAMAIGPQAALPTFMIQSLRSPYEAVAWLLAEVENDELAVKTFGGTLETLLHSDMIDQSAAPLEPKLSRLWLQAKYEAALSEIPERPDLRQKLVNVLHGRPVDDSEVASTPGTTLPDTSGFDSMVKTLLGRIGVGRRTIDTDTESEGQGDAEAILQDLRVADPDQLREQLLGMSDD